MVVSTVLLQGACLVRHFIAEGILGPKKIIKRSHTLETGATCCGGILVVSVHNTALVAPIRSPQVGERFGHVRVILLGSFMTAAPRRKKPHSYTHAACIFLVNSSRVVRRNST